MKNLIAILLTVIIVFILLLGVIELPEFGAVDVPSNNYVSNRYLEKGIEETGALNIVTGIILDYRSFDTFIEEIVLFTGGVLVLMLLKKEKV